jgi:hypothetical protein
VATTKRSRIGHALVAMHYMQALMDRLESDKD